MESFYDPCPIICVGTTRQQDLERARRTVERISAEDLQPMPSLEELDKMGKQVLRQVFVAKNLAAR